MSTNFDECISILSELIAFDTTSALSNLELIGFVEKYLKAAGVSSRLNHNAEGTKANLFATIGPSTRGGIVLSGHTDVVPVAGQQWDTDPFQLERIQNRLYGRGTCDMKGFVAAVLAMTKYFCSLNLQTPIHFAFSYDEEVGCLGVRELLKDLKGAEISPSIVVVGEPTNLSLVSAHKGKCAMRTFVKGKEAHASQMKQGTNAIVIASEFVSAIGRVWERRRADSQENPFFDPEYTTYNVGVIKGGTALNIIPSDCEINWELRPLPGDNPADFLSELEEEVRKTVMPKFCEGAAEASIKTETIYWTPPLKHRDNDAAQILMRTLTQENGTSAVSFGTEAGLYQEAGQSAIICGPGSIKNAHQPNEFIEIEQLKNCLKMLEKIGRWSEKNTLDSLSIELP
ncbi:MAG: acetylornithine deacetylase [Rhizobiaceae bacterium]